MKGFVEAWKVSDKKVIKSLAIIYFICRYYYISFTPNSMVNIERHFKEEMMRWAHQPEPKPIRVTFYNRLTSWYTKEEAILTWYAWTKVMKYKEHPWKTYTPKFSRIKSSENEEQYSWIDITYPKEVASIFRRELEDAVERLQDKYDQTVDTDCLKELYEKIEFAKADLEKFNLHNPI